MSYTITLKYDPTWQALEWAKQHCKSYITNDIHEDGFYTVDNSRIDYFFGNEKDAAWFALNWSSNEKNNTKTK